MSVVCCEAVTNGFSRFLFEELACRSPTWPLGVRWVDYGKPSADLGSRRSSNPCHRQNRQPKSIVFLLSEGERLEDRGCFKKNSAQPKPIPDNWHTRKEWGKTWKYTKSLSGHTGKTVGGKKKGAGRVENDDRFHLVIDHMLNSMKNRKEWKS